jgi:thioredoxin-related protein
VLLVAIAALSLLAILLFTHPRKLELTPGLAKGQAFGNLPNTDYRANQQTLLIALSTTCPYCRESVPLYRRILDGQRDAKDNLRVIALFPDHADEVAKYLKENQLTINSISGVDFRSFHIAGTPTMILVNERGEVSDFWTGKLDERETEQFARSLLSEKASSQ